MNSKKKSSGRSNSTSGSPAQSSAKNSCPPGFENFVEQYILNHMHVHADQVCKAALLHDPRWAYYIVTRKVDILYAGSDIKKLKAMVNLKDAKAYNQKCCITLDDKWTINPNVISRVRSMINKVQRKTIIMGSPAQGYMHHRTMAPVDHLNFISGELSRIHNMESRLVTSSSIVNSHAARSNNTTAISLANNISSFIRTHISTSALPSTIADIQTLRPLM